MNTVNIKPAISNAHHYALGCYQKGYWLGDLDGNITAEAETIFTLLILGKSNPEILKKITHKIITSQRSDGSWELHHQAKTGDLNCTVECYLALRLQGYPLDLPCLSKARQFILTNGGLAKVRIFTRIWLALFGLWPWHTIPVLPPELMLLPTWFPINLYSFAAWCRIVIVPLTIILNKRPIVKPANHFNLDELLPSNFNKKKDYAIARPKSLFSANYLFWLIDKVLRIYHHSPYHPGRQRAIKHAIDWMLIRQEQDGLWAAFHIPTYFSLIALKLLNQPRYEPIITKGIEGLLSLTKAKNSHLSCFPCLSPIWDTALMLSALLTSGLPATTPEITTAASWLVQQQITTTGDWQVYNKKLLPGGWAFEFYNSYYPDIDDTAIVLMALLDYRSHAPDPTVIDNVVKRGIAWLLGMQDKSGGWAAFDKNNTSFFLTKIPFFDYADLLDPPSADVTAHVIQALGQAGFHQDLPAIKKALAFLEREQEKDGSWFGRWGVNYVYGTATVLQGLAAVGIDVQQSPAGKKAIAWLLQMQNSNGGWGEVCESYADFSARGKGPSTASQTAWALLGLQAAHMTNHIGSQKGLQFLIDHQQANGTWCEQAYTGLAATGNCKGTAISEQEQKQNVEKIAHAGFMLKYELYSHYWPLMALGKYQTS